MAPSSTEPGPTSAEKPRWELEQIAVALRGLQFGEVTAIVQDGVVIQVNRLERRRLRKLRRSEPTTEPAGE
jgi:hypothetical protein